MTLRVVLPFILVLAAFSVSGAAAQAGVDPKRQAFNEAIHRELEAESPEAAAVFAEADKARDASDPEAAARGYQRAHELLPRSPHPLRRLCGAEFVLGKRAESVAHCREALSLREDAPELSALAMVLASPGGTPAEAQEAESKATRAVALDGDDAYAFMALTNAALANQSLAGLRSGVAGLDRLAPSEPTTPYFGAILAAFEGRWSDAEDGLDRARALGMSAEQIDGIEARIHDAEPLYLRVWRPLKLFLLTWAVTLALLVGSGFALSRAALRSASQLPPERTGRAHGAEALVRRLYQVVLWLACAFYYASIPLVLGAVLLGGGGILYAFLAIGSIPIKLAAIVIIAVLVTIWSVLKSLFIRASDKAPGTLLRLSEHPRLAALLEEVAGRVGTRAVDCVYLTPDTDIAVFERGGLAGRLRGEPSERCLVLGAGVLEGMRLIDFKAVLAHEFGHFQNEDTAGGGFALAVRRSMLRSATALAQGGVAAWYNPAWWFFRGFFELFLRISQGASRLQETLADRWAAFSYGSVAFERGLLHVIERAVRFNAHASATISEVVERKHALANLYTYSPEKPPSDEDMDREVKSALEREASPYDSHPAPRDRIAAVRALGVEPPEESSEELVWSVFEHRDALEREMTGELRDRIELRFGVEIPAAKAG